MFKAWRDMLVVGVIVSVSWIWIADGAAALIGPAIIGTALYFAFHIAKGFAQADDSRRRRH